MASSPKQTPKLRSSCDECGRTKLRCDRQRPVCGRCQGQGTPCVYGVSRRVGKPARRRMDSSILSTSDSPMSFTGEAQDLETTEHISSEAPSEASDAVESNFHYHDPTSIPFDLDTFMRDHFGQLCDTPAPNPPINFNEWLPSNQFDDSGLLGHMPFMWPAPGQSESQNLTRPHHDCHREAHGLLGNSLFAPSDSSSASTMTPESSPTTDGSGLVALDHLLLMNRRAVDRLVPLLTCHCAGPPYLTILYASIISAILKRYHHAAGDSLGTSAQTTFAQPQQRMDYGGKQPITMTRNAAPILTPVAPMVASSKIAVGAFNVDDDRVQALLKIQLLAGEVRRVTKVIELFASCGGTSSPVSEHSSGNSVDELHENLSAWLKGEYSRVASLIASKLKRLDGGRI